MNNSDCVNIASHLPDKAAQYPDTPAVIIQTRGRGGRYAYTTYTLKQLEEESNRIAHGLESAGIRRNVRTVLMVKPSLQFFALTFALFKVGAVPVMVDPGMGIANLGKCLAEAEPSAFIGITKAHVARVLFGWARESIETLVTAGPRLFWSGYALDDLRRDKPPSYEIIQTAADDMAAILFTSGNTGVPKGAIYTHGVFAHQVRLIREAYGIEPGERDISTFPLFALFGPALGMASIVPEMDASRPGRVDPRNIVDAIHTYNATNMFASPAIVRKVGAYGVKHGTKLPTLRRVISAGAPADTQALRNFSQLIEPGAEVFTPYGATEALPLTSIGAKTILGETASKTSQGAGTCVGKPIIEGSVSIIQISDDPIPEFSSDLELPAGRIGEIAVHGPVVTEEYFNRPESTALAKMKRREGEVYHRMGDVGYLDEQGRLWYCGRKAHRVETAEETLFTLPCERVFDQHPQVARTALVGVTQNGTTTPVLCVELAPEARNANHRRLRDELLALGQSVPHTKSIHTILFHPGFPVDIRHNAKIVRERLAVWAERKTGKTLGR